MKTLKLVIASLLVAIAVAGCAGGSGSANLIETEERDNVTFY